jgi:hypothetical protein
MSITIDPIIIDQYNTSIPLGRAGKYGTLAIEPERFPANVQSYIYMYGLRQVLNDAMADKTDENGEPLPVDQIVAKAEKRLANMYAGELRAQRESAEPVDPIEAEAWKMAKSAMTDAYKAIGAWDVPKGTKDRFAFVIARRRAERGLEELPANEAVADAIEKFLAAPANAHIRKSAERIVRERQKAAGTVNLDELGI